MELAFRRRLAGFYHEVWLETKAGCLSRNDAVEQEVAEGAEKKVWVKNIYWLLPQPPTKRCYARARSDPAISLSVASVSSCSIAWLRLSRQTARKWAHKKNNTIYHDLLGFTCTYSYWPPLHKAITITCLSFHLINYQLFPPFCKISKSKTSAGRLYRQGTTLRW